MIERKNYGSTPLCELRKGKIISGEADFGAAMAFIPDRAIIRMKFLLGRGVKFHSGDLTSVLA